MRQYKHRQHTARANVLRGVATLSPLHDPAGGAVSPDHCRRAQLVAGGRQLQIYDQVNGQLAHMWDLPEVPAAFCAQDGWSWAARGARVLLPFGNYTPTLHDSFPMGTTAPVPAQVAESGWVCVSSETGASEVVRLPDQTGIEGDWVRGVVCTDADVVAVRHQSSDGGLVFSVCDCEGDLQAQTASPHPYALLHEVCAFAPGGGSLALRALGTMLWLWQWSVGESEPRPLRAGVTVNRGAWAVPLQGKLALAGWCLADLFGRLRPSRTGLQVCSATRQCTRPQELSAGGLPAEPASVAWGSRLAVLLSGPPSHLQLYAGPDDSGAWGLEQTVTVAAPRCFALPAKGSHLSVSGDGQLLAAVTVLPEGDNRRLAVVDLESGHLAELELHTALRAAGHDLFVRWVDTAVLVSDAQGFSQLVSFA